MAADVIISPASKRTYPVPVAVINAIQKTWNLTASIDSHPDSKLAATILNDRKITLDDVFKIHTASGDSDLRGGEAGRTWASKIVDGVIAEFDHDQEVQLAKIGYSNDYDYCGLTHPADEDVITAVVRVPVAESTLSHAEALTASAEWKPLFENRKLSTTTYTVLLERDLLAFTASAFLDGARGVVLSYADPICFLESQPLVSSGMPDTLPSKSELIYAVVDATDTTAVLDVIKLKPGPQVYRRDGKSWVLDQTRLESLLSVQPPPIVRLTGDTLKSVLEQLDAGQANHVEPDDNGESATGEALKPQPVPAPAAPGEAAKPAAKPPAPIKSTPAKDTTATNDPRSKPMKTTKPVPETEEYVGSKGGAITASLKAAYHDALVEGGVHFRLNCEDAARHYESDDGYLFPLIASVKQYQIYNLEFDQRTRQEAMVAAVRAKRALETRERELTNLIMPLLADAQSMHDVTPNQRKASALRKYWVGGKGAVKIAWGTSGDFTRCVRQLKKYLGARTEGYCAKRHKETVGYWPGDKKNTGPLKGNTGQKSFR